MPRFLRAANRSPNTVTIYLGAVRKLASGLPTEAAAWEQLRAEHLNGCFPASQR